MLSDSHKQFIITLKNIFKRLQPIIKECKLISKYNDVIISKYQKLAKDQANEKFSPTNHAYINECEYITIFNKYLNNEYTKERKPYHNSWLSLIPFLNEIKNDYNGNIYYELKHNNKTLIINNHNNKIFLTLLHILYNKIKNKTRGHTQDDNVYIEKHKSLYQAICERSEMQQFILDTHKESTNANSCS